MLIPMVYNIERDRHSTILSTISQMIEKNQLRINRDERQFSFEQIGEAHQYIESGKALGKVSLVYSFSQNNI